MSTRRSRSCREVPSADRALRFGQATIAFRYLNERASFDREHTFEGIINNLERRYRETDSSRCARNCPSTSATKTCPDCNGPACASRRATCGSAARRCRNQPPAARRGAQLLQLPAAGPAHKAQVADKILKEITARLGFLINVGLDYLSLDRSAETLSGGEAQRIRLASQIGSGLTGVMYVLDEPSIGLHQRDNDAPAGTLSNLRDLGNTVIVVEHDEDAIRSADYVVDIGPGAGVHGGASSPRARRPTVAGQPGSMTGDYLSGRKRSRCPKTRRPPNPDTG
jgi:excinuclease ABC subunit A